MKENIRSDSMGFIYKIFNNFDDKIYIGLTTKSKAIERWYQHRYSARHLTDSDKSYLHRAMSKYGVDNFSFEIIEEIPNSQLPKREKYWINYYNTYSPNGYNLTKGGEGTPGFSRPQTEEEKFKRGESLKKYYNNHPEAKERMRERMIEQNKNPIFRQRILEGYQNFYKKNPNYFSGENNPFYGKHHTEENLQKIQNAANKRKKVIQQLDKDTREIIAIYSGIKEAEKAINVSHGWISKAARQDKIAYGYRWKIFESVTTNCSSEISTERSGEPQ